MINKLELSTQASSVRRKLGEDELSPIDIFSIVLSIENLTLVFYPLGKNISGACFKNETSSIIAINSDMSIGRQRYSLAHELYHLYFDNQASTTVCSGAIGSGDENERRADQFASYFLMPPAALYDAIQKYTSKGDILALEDIIRLEQYFGVSHKAMLVRLQDEGELSASATASMQSGITNLAARLGYDTALYKASSEDKKIRVLGYYIYQAEHLLNEDLISNGKYEELLLDAFRADLVYGEEVEGGELLD